MTAHEGAHNAEDVRANPNPGWGISHDFHCTHDPCKCDWVPRCEAGFFGARCEGADGHPNEHYAQTEAIRVRWSEEPAAHNDGRDAP